MGTSRRKGYGWQAKRNEVEDVLTSIFCHPEWNE
jgi:hypothetical protein